MADVSLSDWDEAGDVVERALEAPREERDALLARAFAGDAAALARARRLLTAAERAASFLEHPAAELVPELLAGEEVNDSTAPDTPGVIGPYRILGLIGRGGMGEVYLAERADDQFRRQVAVKVVRAGMAPDLVARFRRERQVLASLDHPNIAQLFDGGVTGDGRPYLVMEHVDGRPLDVHADEARLSIEERIDLVRHVCMAVERAHRQLVVHRDLKPANILVTADGHVKLLDFGVAKLLDADGAGHATAMTEIGARLLTPEYASPEQFLGEPATTSTDVHAIGVILYELLAGRRPYEDAERPPAALERRVLDGDPPPPSIASRTTSARGAPEAVALARRTRVDSLGRRLRGDLDNIVLTALRREPERRYASVGTLRDDLERHRAGLPVSARPATVRYRTGKFVRRHVAAVTAAVLVTGAVVVGTTTTLVQARSAAREGQRAAEIRDFLVGVFEISDPSRSRGEAVTARELLDRGSERIGRELQQDPELRAGMLDVLATLYRQLGLFERARTHAAEAVALRRGGAGPPLDLARSLTSLASVRVEEGAADEAEDLVLEALGIARGVEGASGSAVASVLTSLAAVYRALGQFDRAETPSREALEIRRALRDPAGLVETLNGRGVLLNEAGRSAEAIDALDEAAALARDALGAGHTTTVLAGCNLAKARHDAGQLDAALAAFRVCVDARRGLLGDRHPDLGLSLNNMALLHSDRNEYDEAERLYLEALAIQRATFGDRHRAVAGTLNNLAILAFQRGRFDEAAGLFEEQQAVWRDVLGPRHPDTLAATNNLGMSLRSAGRLAEAETILTEVLRGRTEALGPDHPDVGASLVNLSSVVLRSTDFARARALAAEALPILDRAYPDGHPLVGICLVALGRAHLGERRPEEALAAFDRAMALRTRIFGAAHLQTAEARVERGRTLAALGRRDEGIAEIERALADLTAANHHNGITGRDAASALAELRRANGARGR